MSLNVVLVHPEIPPNTGNVGRLCLAVGATLHLVKPLGFRIDDRSLKRAGLDYWANVDLRVWNSLEEFLDATDPKKITLTSAKRGRPFYDLERHPGDFILFGCETEGLPPRLYAMFPERVARIPIDLSKVRSLNLSTAVGIVLYEAARRIRTLDVPGERGECADG
jgi:tRNA (cytidine/uridine-2'-O-)-methyltransferase